jgi:glutathione synthase/RimK-type ligase-like ATP-grasp enzyme
MRKLLILTCFPGEYEPQRLKEETQKAGLKAEIVSYHQLSLGQKKGKIRVDLPRGLKLTDFDLVIPRASAHHQKKPLVSLKTALIRVLPASVFCLNRETFSLWPVLGKIEQGTILAQAGISVIPSWFFPTRAERDQFLAQAKFPLIVKGRFGSHSERTFRTNSPQEVMRLAGQIKGEYFFQPLIKSAFYWRVLVLNDQVLGIMRRRTNKKFFKKGFEREVSEEKLGNLALKATRVLKAEFTGVDLLVNEKGEPLVIEVNRSPQFQIFEKRTKVNLAKELVKYLKLGSGQKVKA